MEEFKGTRGPWFVSNEGNLLIRDESGLSIVAKYVGYVNDEEEVANANLIAAAPDLLELVLHVRNCVKNDGLYEPANLDYFDKIINKALGK